MFSSILSPRLDKINPGGWMYLTIVLAMLLLIYFKSWIRAVLVALRLPGPEPVPLLGNVLLLADTKKLEYYGNACYDLYGPIFRSWLTIIPLFHILEPKYLQHILGSSRHTNKNFVYSYMHNFLGEGLITSSGLKWKIHRKLIQPCFHINVLETFVNTFSECAEKLVETLQENRDVNVVKFVNNTILDILHCTILGLPLDENEDEREKSPFRKGQVLLTYRITRPWLLLGFLFRFTKYARNEIDQKHRLYSYTKNIVDKRRSKNENFCQQDFKSLLDMLLDISDQNPEFTEKDVINEACTFMLAGQDSVGSAVAFCLYYLAQNQEVQKRCLEEMDRIFEGADRQSTLNDLREMTYLEQCVKETLRLVPSVAMFAREISEDVVLGKHTIPAGSQVFISPFATHRLKHIFPEPQKFDPSRFSPENAAKIHPYAYLPFSLGPRNCIGYKFGLLEMKSVISLILRKFQILPVPGRELNLSYRVTLRAKGGIWLHFRRHQTK